MQTYSSAVGVRLVALDSALGLYMLNCFLQNILESLYFFTILMIKCYLKSTSRQYI